LPLISAAHSILSLWPLWRNGRRGRLKICCLHGRAGSSPARGTTKSLSRLSAKGFPEYCPGRIAAARAALSRAPCIGEVAMRCRAGWLLFGSLIALAVVSAGGDLAIACGHGGHHGGAGSGWTGDSPRGGGGGGFGIQIG